MPSYVVAPGAICSIIVRGRHENQEVMSVFHYRYTDSSPIADGAAVLDLIWARWSAVGGMLDLWAGCCSINLVAVETRLQWITPDRFAYITKTDPATPTGKIFGDAYPVNTAVALTKRTLNAGRTQVGTLHMPAVPMTFVSNGGVTPAGTAAYAPLADKVKEEIVTFGTVVHLSPVIFHKTSPSVSPIIRNVSVQPFARVERRRSVGLGS